MKNVAGNPFSILLVVFVPLTVGGCGGSSEDGLFNCEGADCSESGEGGAAGSAGHAGAGAGAGGSSGSSGSGTIGGEGGGGGQVEAFANFPPFAYFEKGATFEYQLFANDSQAGQAMAALGDAGWLTLGRGIFGEESLYLAVRQIGSNRTFDVELVNVGEDAVTSWPVDPNGGWVPLADVGGRRYLAVRDKTEVGKYETQLRPVPVWYEIEAELVGLSAEGWALAAYPDTNYYLVRDPGSPRDFENGVFELFAGDVSEIPTDDWLAVKDGTHGRSWFAVRDRSADVDTTYSYRVFTSVNDLDSAGQDGWLITPGAADRFLGARAH